MVIGWYDAAHMKKLIVVATLILLSSASAVRAETVSTCRNVYGTGEVCGETTTTTTVTHEVVETGAAENQMLQLALGIAGAALFATGLYKLTYKSYILG